MPITNLDYEEITNYERGKRLIQSYALLQFDKVSRCGKVVALWAILGRVWVECDTPGDYRLHQTSVSVYDYLLSQNADS